MLFRKYGTKRYAMATYPEWVTAHRQKGTEIRFINGQYYVYTVTSKWNPEKKRAQKITGKLIGKITPAGFVESSKEKLRKQIAGKNDFSKVVVKEYGLTQFLETQFADVIQKIKLYFPNEWQVILVGIYSRLAFQAPLKQIAFHYGHSFLSQRYPSLILNDKDYSLMLREIGRDRTRLSEFMRSFVQAGEHILVDLTHMPLKSEQIPLSKAGYNSQMDYNPQYNALYVYSLDLKMPVFYRIVPGNIREVKAIQLTLQEARIKDCVLIADKGFYAKNNIQALQENGLQYIIPLRRNNSLIDTAELKRDKIKSGSRYFTHEKRIIWYSSYTTEENQTVYCFLDPILEVKEEQDYISRIEQQQEDYSIEHYHERKHKFGTISIITNLKKKTAQEIYTTYKSRGEIESMFDLFKNVLEADKSYMQNEDTLQGWIFVNHLALLAVYKIYHILQDKKLISKYSIWDFIQHLLEIRAVKINDSWHTAEIIHATGKFLEKIGIECKPIP